MASSFKVLSNSPTIVFLPSDAMYPMQMKKQKSQSTRRWYDCDGEDHGEVANA
jgi:hypothetical protein